MNHERDINLWLEPHGVDRGAAGERMISKEILVQCV